MEHQREVTMRLMLDEETARALHEATRAPGTTSEPVPVRGLLKVNEAAEWLNLPRRSIYYLMQSGALDYIVIGRSRRLPMAGLEAFVRERADLPEGDPRRHVKLGNSE